MNRLVTMVVGLVVAVRRHDRARSPFCAGAEGRREGGGQGFAKSAARRG